MGCVGADPGAGQRRWHEAGLGGAWRHGRPAAVYCRSVRHRRASARRPDHNRGGRSDAGLRERRAGRARTAAAVGSAVAGAGDHRRHRGHQRQRPPASRPRHAARLHHRRDHGPRRRPRGEGRRHRRQERRWLRSLPPAHRLLRLPRRHPDRNVQAGPGSAGLAHGGGERRLAGGGGSDRLRARQLTSDPDRDRAFLGAGPPAGPVRVCRGLRRATGRGRPSDRGYARRRGRPQRWRRGGDVAPARRALVLRRHPRQAEHGARRAVPDARPGPRPGRDRRVGDGGRRPRRPGSGRRAPQRAARRAGASRRRSPRAVAHRPGLGGDPPRRPRPAPKR